MAIPFLGNNPKFTEIVISNDISTLILRSGLSIILRFGNNPVQLEIMKKKL